MTPVVDERRQTRARDVAGRTTVVSRETAAAESRTPRVCHVLYRWSCCGLERQLAQQAARMEGRYRTSVLCSEPPEATTPDVPASVVVDSYPKGRSAERFGAWLSRRVRAHGADLVHVHGLWMLRDGLEAARLAGDVPVVFSFHGFDDGTRAAGWLRRRRWGSLLRRCTALATVSRATRAEFAAAFGDAAASVSVIPNGVDTQRYRPCADREVARSRLGLPRGRAVLLCVGSLLRVKGYDVLLDGLARAGPAAGTYALVFAGADYLRGALQRQAASQLAGHDVRFVGSVADVRPYLDAADLLAAPSRSEGMSNAILEAMSSGLPVIATAVGGTAELVNEETGWLVDAGDAEGLGRAVCAALRDAAEARRRGQCGRARVEREYSLARTVEKVELLYSGVRRS